MAHGAAREGDVGDRAPARLATLVVALLLGGCDVVRLGVMNPAGPIASESRELYIIVAVVLIFVAGPVLLLTPLMAWYYRLSNKDKAYKPTWDTSLWIEASIWVPPTGIVIGLSVLIWTYTHALDPYRPIASAQPPLEVQAVALDWKWLFLYPGEHVAAVNQLAIPVGRPVHISMTSGTVMQSLLIPRLAGQIYAMAGMRTELNLAASKPGIYRGENTQFNGAGFQAQKFEVVALPPAAHAAWLKRVRASARSLDARVYEALARPATVPQPVFYASVPDGMFNHIMMRSQAPAGSGR